MLLADATTLSSLVTTLGGFVSSVLGWVADVGETIVTTPILMIGMVFFLVGGAIGIFKRLLHR